MQLLRSYPCSKAWPTLMHIQAALNAFSEHVKREREYPYKVGKRKWRAVRGVIKKK